MWYQISAFYALFSLSCVYIHYMDVDQLIGRRTITQFLRLPLSTVAHAGNWSVRRLQRYNRFLNPAPPYNTFLWRRYHFVVAIHIVVIVHIGLTGALVSLCILFIFLCVRRHLYIFFITSLRNSFIIFILLLSFYILFSLHCPTFRSNFIENQFFLPPHQLSPFRHR